jgi:hypothetical protein
MTCSVLSITLIVMTVSAVYAQQDLDLLRYGDFKHTRIFENVYFFAIGDARDLGIDMFDESPDSLAQYIRHRIRTHLPTIPILNIYDEVENDPAVQALHKALRETRDEKLIEPYQKLRNDLKLKVEQRYKARYGNKAIGRLSCRVQAKGVAYPIVYQVECDADTGDFVYRQSPLWRRDTLGYASHDNLITRLRTDLDALILQFARVFYKVRGDQQQMQRATIRLAQMTLTEKGFYRGAVDGILGPKTQDAIRQYQSIHKLRVNGKLDKATLRTLKLY